MYVDGYCERTAPGLWGEPFNSVSNVAFLAACVALLSLLARQRRPVPPSVWLLPAIVGVVGLCSLSFHMLASTFTAALDSLSIARDADRGKESVVAACGPETSTSASRATSGGSGGPTQRR